MPVARGQRRGVELAADHRRRAQRADRRRPGSRARRRVSTSCTAVGGCSSASSSAEVGRARPPAGRTPRGRTGCRRCARAARRACVGDRPVAVDARRTPRPTVGGAAARSARRRTACRRASASATSARAPVGSGCARQVASTSSRSSGGGLGEQPQHPQGRGVGPVQVVEDDQQRPLAGGVADGRGRSAPRPGTALRSSAPPARRPGEVRAPRPSEHLRARATAAARRRPASSARPARRRPGSRATRRQLGGQPGLADAGLAGEHGERRAARLGARARPRPARRGPASRPTSGHGGDRLGAARAGAAARPRAAADGDRAAAGLRGDPVQAPGPGAAPRSAGRAARRRLEAQLLVEHGRAPAQHLERVGLASGPGQRERPQRPQPLAQRVGRGQRLELARPRCACWPEGEGGDAPGPPARPAAAPRAGPARRPRGGGVLELGVRRPAPQRRARRRAGDRVGRGRPRSSAGGPSGRPACTSRCVRGGHGRLEDARRRGRRRAPAARSRGRR